MSYLTKAVRENMRKTVLDHAFKEREDAAKAELVAAGEKVYADIYGPHLKAMQSLPEGWLYKSCSFSIAIAGQRHDVFLNGSVLLGHIEQSWNGKSKLYAGDEQVAIDYLKANEKVEDIKNQRNTMYNKVTAILESVRTFKKLWEAWPEAKPLLEHFEEKPPAVYLPAIQFDQINAELGLPPSATGFPWSHRLTASGAYEIGHFGPTGFVKNQEVGTLAEAKQIVDAHNEKLGIK